MSEASSTLGTGQAAAAPDFTLADGPTQKDLFHYNAAFNVDQSWLLVALPSSDACRLASSPAAAQSI